MKCQLEGCFGLTDVIDTRRNVNGTVVSRRRYCRRCKTRYKLGGAIVSVSCRRLRQAYARGDLRDKCQASPDQR